MATFKLVRVVDIGSGKVNSVMAQYRGKGRVVKKTKDSKAGKYYIYVKEK